jgi:hypothetical protein
VRLLSQSLFAGSCFCGQIAIENPGNGFKVLANDKFYIIIQHLPKLLSYLDSQLIVLLF